MKPGIGRVFGGCVRRGGRLHPVRQCLYSPHSLRATSATLLLASGVPIEAAQDLPDHKRIATTQIYGKWRPAVRDSASHRTLIQRGAVMEWMNQNAGAVQAIMAIVIGLLTAVLIGVTWWYANLTRRMASTMERQLAASFEPNIQMVFKNLFQAKMTDGDGSHSESVSGTIIITNNGPLPLKVVAIAMRLIYADAPRFPSR